MIFLNEKFIKNILYKNSTFCERAPKNSTMALNSKKLYILHFPANKSL